MPDETPQPIPGLKGAYADFLARLGEAEAPEAEAPEAEAPEAERATVLTLLIDVQGHDPQTLKVDATTTGDVWEVARKLTFALVNDARIELQRMISRRSASLRRMFRRLASDRTRRLAVITLSVEIENEVKIYTLSTTTNGDIYSAANQLVQAACTDFRDYAWYRPRASGVRKATQSTT